MEKILSIYKHIDMLFTGNDKKRIDDINLLRVIACFMVIILHGFILIQDILPSTLWTHLLYTPAWGGVWIFVILAGFLAGKSFYDGKYAISKKGFFLYYKRKFFRLAPSYYFLVFITTVLVNINFFVEHPKTYLHILTFTYTGNPGVVSIGATWYISVIFQLFLFAPFLIKFFSHVTAPIQWFLAIAFLGLFCRILGVLYIPNYMGRIYNSFFGNIDIFTCGILLNFINLSHINLSKHCIYRLFFCFILINIFIYSSGNSILLFIYEAIFPTVYLSFVTLILLMRERVCVISPQLLINLPH